MNVKELARRIENYRQTSMPIYDNHAPIYGNDAPICHSTESALAYILDVSPETYQQISDYIEKGKKVAAVVALDHALEPIIESSPENYREILKLLRDILIGILSP